MSITSRIYELREQCAALASCIPDTPAEELRESASRGDAYAAARLELQERGELLIACQRAELARLEALLASRL